MKKFLCVKLVLAFSFNFLIAPFAHSASKKYKYNKRRSHRCYTHNKHSLRNNKLLQRIRKEEIKKRSKHHKQEQLEKISKANQEIQENLKILEKEKRALRTHNKNNNKKRNSKKTLKDTPEESFSEPTSYYCPISLPKVGLSFVVLFILFLTNRAKCAEFRQCKPGTYLFELTHPKTGNYYDFELDCNCELYTDPIFGFKAETLVCDPFPPTYSDHCKSGTYDTQVSGISRLKVITAVKCKCKGKGKSMLTCSGIFGFEYKPENKQPRRSLPSNNNNNAQDNCPTTQCPITCSEDEDLSLTQNKILLLHPTGENKSTMFSLKTLLWTLVGGTIIGACCCSPCACMGCGTCVIHKKKIKKALCNPQDMLPECDGETSQDSDEEEEDPYQGKDRDSRFFLKLSRFSGSYTSYLLDKSNRNSTSSLGSADSDFSDSQVDTPLDSSTTSDDISD